MAIARTILKGLPDDYAEQAVSELAALYQEAAEGILRNAERRLLKDARRLTVSAQRSRLLLTEVEEILQDLDTKTAQWIATKIPKAYRTGARRTAAGLAEIGEAGAFGFNGDLHQEALDLLILDMQDDLLAATESMRRNFRRTLRRTQLPSTVDRALTRDVAKSLIEGKTRRQLTKDIQRTLLEEFKDKPLTINGKQYDIASYSELVARTKASEAVNAGTINRMIDAEQDLVMVTRHGATDGCGFYEGRVFSISGTSDRYPSLSELPNGGPPFHPNCKHSLAPFVEDLATGAEKRRGADINQKVLGKPYKDVERIARAA